MTNRKTISCEVVRDEDGDLSLEISVPNGTHEIYLNERLPICRHLHAFLNVEDEKSEEKDNAAHELLIQEVSDKKGVRWPCLCGEEREMDDGHLLCTGCWAGIPPMKREGLRKLKENVDDIVEYTMAAEQILRIAAKNHEGKKNHVCALSRDMAGNCFVCGKNVNTP